LPEEIAVSIIAEIIQLRGGRSRSATESRKSAVPVLNLPVLNQPVLDQQVLSNEARDPVCGMNVSGAKYKSEHNGTEIYFCCAGCKHTFERQPEKYTHSISS
jgi:xanthine dehydrogenase accessory factor